MINQQDRKNIQLMLEILKEYRNNRLYLNILIEKLDALFRLTSKTQDPWRKQFLDELLNIESVYAGALSQNRLSFSNEEELLVDSWLKNLEDLILDLFSSYLKLPDPTVNKKAEEMQTGWLMCPYCVDAWESSSTDAMVLCPKCDQALHNPRYKAAH